MEQKESLRTANVSHEKAEKVRVWIQSHHMHSNVGSIADDSPSKYEDIVCDDTSSETEDAEPPSLANVTPSWRSSKFQKLDRSATPARGNLITKRISPTRKSHIQSSDGSEQDALESTILEVPSPVKPSPVNATLTRYHKLPVRRSTSLSQQTCPSNSHSQQKDNDNLSSHISEDASTPSMDLSMSEATPIAQWICMGKPQTVNADITEFESPKKKETQRAPTCIEYSEQWTVMAGKRRRRRFLGEKAKAIVSRYESSVKMFPHDLRMGKFDEDQAVPFVIRNIFGKEDKLIWTLCHNLQDRVDHCIIFKPLYPNELVCEVILKLFRPWKEIEIPGVPLPVIICADFYRIYQKRDDIGVWKNVLAELKSTPIPFNINYFRIPVTDDLASILPSLVPNYLKNQNTILKQMSSYKYSVDLDAVIHKSWLSKSGDILILLSDTDNHYSLLRVPSTHEQFLQVVQVGRMLKFRKLRVLTKTTIYEDGSFFSILRLLESKQSFYFTLGLLEDTRWVEMESAIPFRPITICPKKFNHQTRNLS